MKKVKDSKKGIGIVVLISILLVFIGVILFKIGITGDVIVPPCGGGTLIASFDISGAKAYEDSASGVLHYVTVMLQPVKSRNCMYSGKTNKQGGLVLNRIVAGDYKLTIWQKDIGRGKTLCDVYKDNVAIKENQKYNIVLKNCIDHAFNI